LLRLARRRLTIPLDKSIAAASSWRACALAARRIAAPAVSPLGMTVADKRRGALDRRVRLAFGAARAIKGARTRLWRRTPANFSDRSAATRGRLRKRHRVASLVTRRGLR
jgi:hypothetical protein